MKIFKLSMLIISVLAISCTDETNKLSISPIPPESVKVNLSAPETGQKSIYIRYQTSCKNIDEDFEFTGDTLILEVKKIASKLFFNEYLTQKSPMFINKSFADTIKHEIRSIESNLLIPNRFASALFYFYGNDTIRLNSNADILLKQNACRLTVQNDIFVGNDLGIVSSIKMGSITKENKMAVSCVPMTLDLDAYLIYDKYQLHMSTVAVRGSLEQKDVSGWVLIE